jgi:hypothetical protein
MDNVTSITTALTETDKVLFHASGIKTAWNKSVEAFIETGQLLLAAKKAMSGTGKWLQLFNPKIGDLPFGEDTAERLMRIAKNKVLTNSANWRNLPPSIRTLDVLSKDTKRLERWLLDGTVNADTELKQAQSLVSPKKPAKAVKKDTDDTVSDNTCTEREAQDCLGHLYNLVCDSRIDWMKVIQAVGSGMVCDIIEELTSRLNDHAEAARREEEFQLAAPVAD